MGPTRGTIKVKKQEKLKHGELIQRTLLDSYPNLTIMGMVDWLLHRDQLDISGWDIEKPDPAPPPPMSIKTKFFSQFLHS